MLYYIVIVKLSKIYLTSFSPNFVFAKGKARVRIGFIIILIKYIIIDNDLVLKVLEIGDVV